MGNKLKIHKPMKYKYVVCNLHSSEEVDYNRSQTQTHEPNTGFLRQHAVRTTGVGHISPLLIDTVQKM